MVIQIVFNLLGGDIRDNNRFTLIIVKTGHFYFVSILVKKIPAQLFGSMTVVVILQPSMPYTVQKSKLFSLGLKFKETKR